MDGEENTMTVQPIRDQVVVKKEEAAQTTASGLFIAHADEKNVKGTVVAVGSGRLTMSGVVPLDVREGDKVLFNKNNAIEVKDGDQTYLVLREDNVICVLK
jgi:chaperonin GroES